MSDPLKTDLKKESFHQLQFLFPCLLQRRTKGFLNKTFCVRLIALKTLVHVKWST